MTTRYRIPSSAYPVPPASIHSTNPLHPPSDKPNNIIEHTKKDATGRVSVKKYLKGALLGKGGFAKCFQVTDLDTKEDWACKIIQKSSLTKQRHKQKLQSEIKIHKSLSHKNIVRFHDVFEDKENVYIVMELCPNQTMLEHVKRRKRLSESDTRRFMLQILDAVRFMHQYRVIHRDLKLGNFFLGKNNEVKIGDFGLACKLQFDGERKKTLCGTPNYIAPEVLDGKDGHSYEVDIWSIGVILYTCLVGKPPFETADVKSTYKLIQSNTYSFPPRLEISESAKALVRSILQSRPEKRPSIEDIMRDDFFLGQGIALLQGRDDPLNTSGNNSGNRGKLKDALIFSSSDRDSESSPTKKVTKQMGALDVKDKTNFLLPTSSSSSSSDPATTIQRKASDCGSDAASSASTASAPVSARSDKDVPVASAAVEDEHAMRNMHNNITAALSSAVKGSSSYVGTLPLPQVWVSSWVDYSKKYGLGYKLSNDQYGVFFNDSTKILLQLDGSSFEYMERQRMDGNNVKFDKRSSYTMGERPAELNKKVTLLGHFKNYLNDSSKVEGGDKGKEAFDRSNVAKETEDGIYVRKWMRTRHSVIFRLSNNCFQISFNDDSEVFLWASRRWVTYRSRTKPLRTMDLKDAACDADIAKRLKYADDILVQLLAA
ncbi:hypothetical protein GUITHDRAFT_88322 [Guillardia theta CCMP2712]|uniref:Serine/threonine-protein kinase PLK n=1 Tax=Guillardia theta (strain CCMP2712) TaxID=905079 RepID=L1J128_GUITC|nr:hypothetical protein GUITHDRAFT_88322 [Guillardia theta CCMP2712]EKX41770.1 hypothetical protein GUITHDRAFT_88322 [Guillardia theta CCMP2712]|eukprot:XP_005828750.1 hypothetical protein GUITHDRAFT_88322 [Guillardia theta CCMP2712]